MGKPIYITRICLIHLSKDAVHKFLTYQILHCSVKNEGRAWKSTTVSEKYVRGRFWSEHCWRFWSVGLYGLRWSQSSSHIRQSVQTCTRPSPGLQGQKACTTLHVYAQNDFHFYPMNWLPSGRGTISPTALPRFLLLLALHLRPPKNLPPPKLAHSQPCEQRILG